MQTNYYFLRQLSQMLAQRLYVNWAEGANSTLEASSNGMKLVECFSQSKDELVLGFCNESEEFYIKAVLEADFPCLTFPQSFARAKRNSVDLLGEIHQLQVLSVVQNLNERSFFLQFEQDYQLLFKMHGRRSNIILFRNQKFIIGFHKKLAQDRELNPLDLDRLIDQSWEAFEQKQGNWKVLFPTFGSEINQYWQAKGVQEMSLTAQWDWIQNTLLLLNASQFWVVRHQATISFSLLPPLPTQETLWQGDSPIEASNEFYYRYTQITTLESEKRQITKELQKKIKQIEAYIQKNFERLATLDDNAQNEKIGHLIMANLHQIPVGAESVEVEDFYTQQTKVIKLKKELSPQKNAENYYRKAKNEKIEIQTLQVNLERKEKELLNYQQHLAIIQTILQLKELRKYIKENQLSKEAKSEKPNDQLFKKFLYQGFEIWVGKNAKNNDLLTQKYAYKEDLWLHAKDVSGSHVVIKYQAGKSFPSDVIAKAASLAAYYSKRSHDSFCPVLYTPKKFVRKTKDLADGQVIVEKEEVIMVVPEKF